MSEPNEQRSSVSAQPVQGNAAPRRALSPESVADVLEQLAAELAPPKRYARSEQGRDGLLWTVYEGDEGDFVTGRRIASFVREEDARAFVFGIAQAVRVVDMGDLERVEGDARGVLLLLKLDDRIEGHGPCIALAPAVVEAAHAQLMRPPR